MKKILFAAAFLLALQASAQDPALTGNWKAAQKGGTVYIVFGADSTFMMVHEKDTLGGKKFIFGEGPAKAIFKVDTTTSPKQMDFFIVQTASGAVINQMRGIYDWIDADHIRIRMSMDGSDRPKALTPRSSQETLYFSRKTN